MLAPTRIVDAARARVRQAAPEIKKSLKAIAAGCPGDAEPDTTRRQDVFQLRTGVTQGEARRLAPKSGPEAIWGETIDFVDVTFFERGRQAARSVCRIISRNGQPIGTGFLISPNLLITNNHVIGSAAAADGMLAEFDYEKLIDGSPRMVTRFALDPRALFVTSDRDDLDYTVVALGSREAGAKAATEFGYLPLSGARNKHVLGDLANLIQHPDGRMKEAVVRENQLVSRSGTVLHYVADTEPGSSGSPVFNVFFNVVALHHWGGPHRGLVDEKGVKVPRTVNEGIRTSAIVADLQTRQVTLAGSTRALLEEALRLGVENSPLATTNDYDSASGPGEARRGVNGATLSQDGTATWEIPLTVSVRLGGAPTTSSTASTTASASSRMPAANAPVEEAKLVLDENYADRSGYNPDFLGGTPIALPALSAAQKQVAAKNKEAKPGDDPHELRYEHFSVVMNGKRRLAFFTATNIDGADSKDVDRKTGKITDASADDGNESAWDALNDSEGAEAAELWFRERRIDEKQQTPQDLFANQTAFDASGNVILNKQTNDFRNRMFQQGHLTRRQDPLWGGDREVIRANADTFHVTNRAPQVGYFNMGVKKPGAEAAQHGGGTLYWRALEEFVLANARADRQRVTVFTGPVFDDANDFPWSRKRPDLKGFKAPREFWKVVLRKEQGKLHATALLIDQSPLIDSLPELLDLSGEEAKGFAFEKVKKYQVSVAQLESKTGLDFGQSVRAADTFSGGNERISLHSVEKVSDVALDLPYGRRDRRKVARPLRVHRVARNGHAKVG